MRKNEHRRQRTANEVEEKPQRPCCLKAKFTHLGFVGLENLEFIPSSIISSYSVQAPC